MLPGQVSERECPSWSAVQILLCWESIRVIHVVPAAGRHQGHESDGTHIKASKGPTKAIAEVTHIRVSHTR